MLKEDAFVLMKRAIDCKPKQNNMILSSASYIMALTTLF